ncbi:MAG TPA: ATP-dependent helicase [Nitratifractor sp.]|nr:ATP-dependent helicase [Nitratifractor sp.]HHH20590.1 ATP-dependent helicase [Nitratifractor sp.]
MPLKQLNAQQHVAATATSGKNLIIASAGTGKTSTIVGRIAYLLQNGTDPSKILLLTFTNKAAAEMVARLKRYFDAIIIDKIEAGTFHAVAYRWLKAKNPHLSLKQPGELKTLFRSVYDKRQFHRLSLATTPFSATFLYELYSLYQNSTLDTFSSWMEERYKEHISLLDIYQDIIDEFEATKEEYGFASFNDLLILTIKSLQKEPMEFAEVLVDEYQDTNTLQEALINALKPKSLFCVGDYDQSIYAFNGANIENISTFALRYDSANVYSLSVNYRSTRHILELANRVICKNERIYPKELKVGKSGESIPPKLLIFDTLFEQYQTIAQNIKASNTSYEDIAIIFRNNSSADGLEASLRELGIPCKRKGGTSFFDSKEIRFILDILTLLVNSKDLMAFIHTFEYAKNVGAALAKDIFLTLSHFGNGNLIEGIVAPVNRDLPNLKGAASRQLGLFDDHDEIGLASRFNGMGIDKRVLEHPIVQMARIETDALQFFEKFYRLFKELKREQSSQASISKIINSKLYEHVVNSLATQRAKLKTGEIDQTRKEEAKKRIYNKSKLLLELSRPYYDVSRFINAMILGGGELSEGEGVNLLTVHASKGLEFNDVYIVDLADSRFPNRKLMSKNGGLEEERRLFYVAVTRAKQKLYLSFAKYDKIKKVEYKPSQFLYEAGLLKESKEGVKDERS